MSHFDQFKQLIRDIGERFEIPDLNPESDGVANLIFEVDENTVRRTKVEIKLDEETGNVELLSYIGTVDADDRERILTDLLQANTLWGGTGGATIGLDDTEEEITICFKKPLGELNPESLENLLIRFKAIIGMWANLLIMGETPNNIETLDDASRIASDRFA